MKSLAFPATQGQGHVTLVLLQLRQPSSAGKLSGSSLSYIIPKNKGHFQKVETCALIRLTIFRIFQWKY